MPHRSLDTSFQLLHHGVDESTARLCRIESILVVDKEGLASNP
jgi:hypothetical protein